MTSLSGRIVDEIANAGPMAFSRFMELALYDDQAGFYAQGGGAGRSRDFLTSPEVGPLFGHVVSRALDSWWDDLGRPDPFFVVEVGAGPGSLARGVRHGNPACAPALRYLLVDRSAGQRAQHGAHLPLSDPAAVLDPAPQAGPLVASLATAPRIPGAGVVLANELLDNLPFDLFHWEATLGWREVRVDVDGTTLVESLEPTDFTMEMHQRLSDADRPIRVPRIRAAQQWLHDALHLLDRGRVVAFDYAVEAYPVGSRKWLRTYQQHDKGVDPLQLVGEQDITADVAIDQLAIVASLEANRTQAVWLRHYGITELVNEGRDYWAANAATGDLKAVRYRSRITESEALLDTKGLGGFRVLEWRIPT